MTAKDPKATEPQRERDFAEAAHDGEAQPETSSLAPKPNSTTASITLTAKAAQAVKERAKREGKVGQTLRLFVMGGGCSGVTYKMDFEDTPPRDSDVTFTQHGIVITVDPKSLQFLQGSTLDYKAELMSQRFVWSNPNAKSSCGCGESFGV
jgi:iron-sulfur cluster assembly accessory protein